MNINNPRLVFVGLYNDTNLGDPIIASSTEWLFSQFTDLKERSVHLSLFPKQSLYARIKRRIKRQFSHSLSSKDYERSLFEYYKKNIKERDVIIVVGGGLIKYKYQNFDLALINLLEAAHKRKAIIVFNSVGIEGYDENAPRCQRLKQEMLKATQNKTLIYISTRDDIYTLREKYFDNQPIIPCIKVADPAVWCANAFNINRSTNNKIIGIGIIRGNIFIDNDISYTASQLFDLYIGIIKELKNRNSEVRLFTNGTKADNLFAKRIQKRLKEKENIECKLILPTSSSELIHGISQFKGIIAGRLHSCIIAYSLNIPAIGLVWNDKLTLFGNNIGAKENFITHDKFSAIHIVNQLYKSMQNGYDANIALQFKQTILDSIKEITHLHINLR